MYGDWNVGGDMLTSNNEEKSQIIGCVNGYNVLWYAGRNTFILNPAEAMLVTPERANKIIQRYHHSHCFAVEASIIPKRLSYLGLFLLWFTTKIRRHISGSGFRFP